MTALSLGIFTIEAQFPVSSVGGIKLGLANVVTLCAMVFIDRGSAGIVTALRIILASAFYGTFVSFLFSICAGTLAYLTMCLLINMFDRKQLWVVSVFGAIAHNAGQLCMAAVISGSAAVVSLAPFLAVSGIITGALTGLTAQRLWFSPLQRL